MESYRGQKWTTKIVTADLDSPRQELSVHGLRFVVTFWFVGKLIVSVRLLGVQFSYKFDPYNDK